MHSDHYMVITILVRVYPDLAGQLNHSPSEGVCLLENANSWKVSAMQAAANSRRFAVGAEFQ